MKNETQREGKKGPDDDIAYIDLWWHPSHFSCKIVTEELYSDRH